MNYNSSLLTPNSSLIIAAGVECADLNLDKLKDLSP